MRFILFARYSLFLTLYFWLIPPALRTVLCPSCSWSLLPVYYSLYSCSVIWLFGISTVPVFFWEKKGEKDKGHQKMRLHAYWPGKTPINILQNHQAFSYVLALSGFLERMLKVTFFFFLRMFDFFTLSSEFWMNSGVRLMSRKSRENNVQGSFVSLLLCLSCNRREILMWTEI